MIPVCNVPATLWWLAPPTILARATTKLPANPEADSIEADALRHIEGTHGDSCKSLKLRLDECRIKQGIGSVCGWIAKLGSAIKCEIPANSANHIPLTPDAINRPTQDRRERRHCVSL